MNSRKTELAVGIFALLVFVLLTYMTFKVGEFTIGKREGYTVHATFEDTAGLYEKTKIKIAGVDAGTIERIDLVEGRARLTLRIYPEIILYDDAAALIKQSGLLGDKYLEVRVGSPGKPRLPEGAEIKNIYEFSDIDDLFRNVGNLTDNLNAVIGSLNGPDTGEALRETVLNLKSITDSMDYIFAENKDKMSSIIDRIDSLTTSLDELLASNRAPISNTIANLEGLTATLRDDAPGLITDLSGAVRELKGMVEENRESVRGLMSSSSSAMESINTVARKIEKGEGTIGKLVHDDALYTALKNTVGSAEKALSAIERFRTYVTFRGEYLSGVRDGKGHFYVTLAPRKDKYYIFGIVGDPIGSVDAVETVTNGSVTRTETVEQDLEFTAQFARRFNNTALRVGLVESTFGVGADHFLLDDRLRLFADMWDFGEDEYLADAPHLNIGADYFLFKNVFVTAGVDNLLNSNRVGAFLGGGVKFEDEDLKYIFGTVPSVPIR